MNELPEDERVRRVIAAASRKGSPRRSDSAPGEAIHRACLGASQILDARPDGEVLRFRNEPRQPTTRRSGRD